MSNLGIGKCPNCDSLVVVDNDYSEEICPECKETFSHD